MDTSIPPGVAPEVVEKLSSLNADYTEGLLTEKGYLKKRNDILGLSSVFVPSHQSRPSVQLTVYSEMSTSELYYRVPELQEDIADDKAGQDFKVLQKPLDPREVPELALLERFDNLPSILRLRASTYQKEIAMVVVDSKGKETNSISWEKLYLKAEKISQNIKNKSGLYRGDRVCLIYQSNEIIEFTIALMGCFLAGVVAVPISIGLPVKIFIKIMNDTQAHLCLMSETASKHFDKINQNAQNKLEWPKGVEWWKTTDMGSYQPPNKKADPPALHVPDLAYIEFSKSPTGELRGVVLSHRTIMHQMNCLVKILSSKPGYKNNGVKRSEISFTRSKNVMLSTLDPRQSVGLIAGILCTVFTGNLLIWMPQTSMEVPGLYANVITRYKVSLLLSDYLGLKQVVYNYQSFPQLTRTFNKRIKVDLSCVRWCLINALTIDSEFHELLTDRWFFPLGCKDPKNIIAPMLTLSEHGGMVISMRDWIGKEEKLGCILNNVTLDDSRRPDNSSDLSEVFIDKDSLMTNTVKIVNDRPPPVSTESSAHENGKYIRVGAFGYPLPDATLAIINPETNMLSGVMEVGEIWIDSPSLSGGFWGLSKYTEAIFHARCTDYEGTLDLEFLRTGLLGFEYNGKVYVLGLYEDRLKQRVTWIDKSLEKETKEKTITTDYRYHYATHLVKTLARNVRQVSDCSFFDIFINKEYLSVAIIESPDAKAKSVEIITEKQKDSDLALLDSIATQSINTLEKIHNVRLYCVIVTPPDTLPRTIRSGRSEIANMLCKRKFNEGTLPSVYVKFNIKRSVSNLPRGKDLLGGIWSKYVSGVRAESLNLSLETQYSGLDYRDVSIDDRTKVPLTDFKTLVDIMRWRASHQPDELAFSISDRYMKETKPLTWKKFETKVSALCCYIVEKSKLKAGDHVILMYALSEEFIIACFACFVVGIVPIPMVPIDASARLTEDTGALSKVIKDYKVECIFTHPEVEGILKSKAVSNALKTVRVLPKIKSTVKYNKPSLTPAVLASKISKWQAKFDFRNEHTTCIIWLYWTLDHHRIGAKLTHKILMNMCKVVKETCLMTSSSPLVGCVRHVSGLGFLQSSVLGVFLGSTTYLISPVDYSHNPSLFFQALARYKVKDTYVTPQMLKHAVSKSKMKGYDLSSLKNLMVSCEGRPNLELMRSVKLQFASVSLAASAISHTYVHDFNPMVTTRSYMAFEPVDLWLDPVALRQGYISIVNPGVMKDAIHVQDSGMVPVCTQIAIVNPETCELCKVGEYGEIWVCAESSVLSYSYGSSGVGDAFTDARFTAKIKNGNPEYTYLRTGDLGFLHNLVSDSSESSDIQPLFVLGRILETFEVMGLHHFVSDIEKTVETCHSNIYRNGTCVFKCGAYTVLVVEPKASSSLSALVPLIVNKVLSRHSLIIDIVAFTKKDTFPLSRLGEKQRANIVKGWTENKLPLSEVYGVNYGEDYMVKLVKQIDGFMMESVKSDSLNGWSLSNGNPDTELSSELSVINPVYSPLGNRSSPNL